VVHPYRQSLYQPYVHFKLIKEEGFEVNDSDCGVEIEKVFLYLLQVRLLQLYFFEGPGVGLRSCQMAKL
jgi:hypothetical protein